MPYIGNPIYQSAFVTDQFSGTGSQTAYTMSVAPAGTTNVLVVVSGVVQDPSTYGVVGNTLNFTTAPPTGTGNISCRYLGVPVTGVTTTAYRTVTEFTATSGQTTFTPPSYNVGFINVYLNGVLLGSADYTASNGTTVVLTTGAAAGNLVTVESFSISSVANAIPNAAGAINLAGSLISGVLPVANGGTGVTTSTGSGANVLGTSPVLTTPNLGTPSAINLSNATALAAAALPAGVIKQVAYATNTSTFSSSSTSYVTTGKEITITPLSASSRILVAFFSTCYTAPSDTAFTLYRNNSTNIGYGGQSAAGYAHLPDWAPMAMVLIDFPATTSATTYTAYGKTLGTGTWYYGLSSLATTMFAMEIAV
jgi:hypothetical protein